MSDGPPFKLKPLSKEAIPRALEKAMRYRLLNEPLQAESICRDILATDADNQQAVTVLVLSLTDQFEKALGRTVAKAREWLPQLDGEYKQTYYEGLIFERQGKALLGKGGPGAQHSAYECLCSAMDCYEKAEEQREDELDDEAVLRWNTCARIIMDHQLQAGPEAEEIHMLE